MSNLSEKQVLALELVLSGHNLLLLGSAGTGKSYIVREIVKQCLALGKNVSLTCTTGIACNVYKDIKAQTIHKWSGINDGRYSPSEIGSVFKNNPIYTKTVDQIRNTDVLIIDECSMLSKRMFNCLSEVCLLKNENLLFGGIQLVLCGDFHQLSPVPNALCNEDGDYCFNSELFSTILPHKVTLSDVYRQSEPVLIQAIQEVASGNASDDTLQLISSLKRPLLHRKNSIQLFSTNDHVDDFNRKSILDFPGPVYEFISNDTGEKRYLTHILAPHVLWLKIAAPVILLKNLSDKLVNGLRGEVYDVEENTVIVEFPTLDLKVPMEKVKFSVFSRTENKDIAVREQLPLKLAYALTIHKSQGMTLDSVEIDCSGIFKPGQLGVAMGRAKSIAGLRILHFNQRACMPHPLSVKTFLEKTSVNPVEDKSCCQIRKRVKENPSMFTVQETLALGIETDIDLDGEPEFDDEFDEIIRTIDAEGSEIKLPEDLNLRAILEKLTFKDPVTTFQCNTNSILNSLDRGQLKKYCQKEYKQITSLADKIDYTEAVKCKDLGKFYTAIHEHQTSAEYLLQCMMMFEGERFTAEHKYICFNISVELRKFILSKHAELYPSTSMKLTQRSVTNASRARIRYIGGYCIAKVRSKFLNKKEALRYAKSAENQQNYEEALCATRILNSLREDEQFILSNSTEPDSLLDVSRRQYVNRGLTNISDETFNFFIKLSNKCLCLLTDETYHKYGNEMFEACKQKILETEGLYESFSSLIQKQSEPYCDYSSAEITVDESTVIRKVFQKILKVFLLVLFAQFRKDILDSFKISKKMAHRKQIQVSKTGSKTSKKGRNDGLDISKKVKKKKMTVDLPSTSQANERDPVPEQCVSIAETTTADIMSSSPIAETTTADVMSSSPSIPQVSRPEEQESGSVSPVQSTSQCQENEEELCKVCWTADREIQWIQCDSCSSWLHRGCAGLKHHMKWKKFQRKGSIFYCKDCE